MIAGKIPCQNLRVAEDCKAGLNDIVLGGRRDITKHKRLFAVKEDGNELLEIARETYKENCEDMDQCAWWLVASQS